MKRHLTPMLLGLGLCFVPMSANAAGPFYVTAAIANASTDLDVTAGFERLIDDDDTGWSVGVGFHISRYLAIEGAYNDFGTAGESSICSDEVLCVALFAPVEVNSTAVTISVLPHWPLTDHVSLYGRIGVASWESEISAAFSNTRFARARDEELVFGAGARFAVAGPIGAFAEVSRVADTFQTISIGATWGF